MSEAPGPWQADGPRRGYRSNTPHWVVRRHKPGHPFNEQVVLSPKGLTKRFSSIEKATEWADKLNKEAPKP